MELPELTGNSFNGKIMGKEIDSIVITDIHISDDNHESISRLIVQIYEFISGLVYTNRPKRIIIAGDVFTYRKSQSLKNLIFFMNILDELSQLAEEILIIPGNHDKVDDTSDDSYLTLFDGISSAKVFNQPSVYKTGDINYFMIPYYAEDIYMEKLSDIKKVDNKVINIAVTHIGINGAYLNDSSGKYESAITNKDFVGFDLVLVGHFHNRSHIGSNIVYIGSMMPDNFGEDPNKGFTIIYKDGSYELMNLKFSKYTTIDIDISEFSEEDVAVVVREAHKQALEQVKSGDIVRIVFKCMRRQSSGIDINKFMKDGIDVRFNELDIVNKYSDEEAGFVEFNEEIIRNELDKFLTSKDMNVEEGQEILNKALNKK